MHNQSDACTIRFLKKLYDRTFRTLERNPSIDALKDPSTKMRGSYSERAQSKLKARPESIDNRSSRPCPDHAQHNVRWHHRSLRCAVGRIHIRRDQFEDTIIKNRNKMLWNHLAPFFDGGCRHWMSRLARIKCRSRP